LADIMSFPQGPYQQPGQQQPNPYGYAPMGYYSPAMQSAGALLGPARWTCGLMIATGVILLLVGGCFGVIVPVMDMPEFAEAMEKGYREAGGDSSISMVQLKQAMRIMFIGMAIAGAVGGICAIAAGIWSSKGARGGLVTSIVIAAIVTVTMLVFIVFSLPVGLCVFGVPLILSVIAIVTAVKALGNAKQIDLHNTQLQMWQQQQAYAYQQQQQQPPQS
jgi:hypothetical protein